jgi:hypothetical protein
MPLLIKSSLPTTEVLEDLGRGVVILVFGWRVFEEPVEELVAVGNHADMHMTGRVVPVHPGTDT